MKIVIHAIGHLKETHWKAAEAEYLKRLQPYASTEVREYDDFPSSPKASLADETKVKERECEQILRHLKPSDFVVILDLGHEELTSEELSESLMRWFAVSGAAIHFVVGGSLGLSDEMKRRANARLCLSKLTFPHQLARIVLLEQLYRSFRIARNEPYHK